jgi:hypothetical protein
MMKTSSSNEFKDDINKDGIQAEEEVKGEKKIDLRKTANLRTLDPIPDVEWWDA